MFCPLAEAAAEEIIQLDASPERNCHSLGARKLRNNSAASAAKIPLEQVLR